MPRQERHLRYQLSFETERERIRQEEAALYRKAALELTAPTADTNRFVRKVKEEVFVRCPRDVAAYLANQVYTPFEHFEQEEFWVLLLNTRNRVTHDVMVYRGTINTIYVRVAEIFKEAIRYNSNSIILSHCHPSGDPTPSPQDVHLTENACEAGRLLDIQLADHVIMGDNCWVSLKERGLGFGHP